MNVDLEARLIVPRAQGMSPGFCERLFDWTEFDQLATWIADRADDAETECTGIYPEIVRIRAAGLLSACAPAGYAGLDVGQTAGSARMTFELLRRLGYASLPVARLYEGHMNAAKLVSIYGSSELKAKIFGETASAGSLLGVWAADGERPLTYEVKVDGSILLRGQKAFASGLGCVAKAVVTAQQFLTDGPNQLFVVDVTDTGRQDKASWKANGMKATLSGVFNFDGIRLPALNQLGAPGDYEKEPYFDGGIWRYCAAHIGGTQALIDASLHILDRRGQLSAPLQLSRMGTAIASCRAASALVREWAERVEGTDPQNIEAAKQSAAGAKLARVATSNMAIDVMEQCERSLGTLIHMAGNPADRIRRDLALYIRQAAPDDKLLTATECLVSNRLVKPLW